MKNSECQVIEEKVICDKGTFEYNGDCYYCDDKCADCLDGTGVCTECDATYSLGADGKCSCPTGYEDKGTRCEEVYNPCDEGFVYDGTHCVCPKGTSKNEFGYCLPLSCDDGQFILEQNGESMCATCDQNCAECKDYTGYCDKCQSNY